MNWKDPGIALITGASSGIGAEFARQLAKQGFDLILIARRKIRLNRLSKELQDKYSISAEVFVADLSNMDDNKKIVMRILELGDLDILINNAGFGFMNAFLQLSLKELIDMINVHLTSTMMFCYAAFPNMIKKNRGVIINLSSIVAVQKNPVDVMYNTTKTAVAVFSEMLREKIKETGIYIQCICPGLTYTEFHDTKSMWGFKRDFVPKEYWMEAKDVVSLSLEAVKTNVIFIPGELNLKNTKEIRKNSIDDYLNMRIL